MSITPTHPDYELLKEFYNNHIGEVGKPFEDTEQEFKDYLANTFSFAGFKFSNACDRLITNIISAAKHTFYG